jgi:hypothetical protein
VMPALSQDQQLCLVGAVDVVLLMLRALFG